MLTGVIHDTWHSYETYSVVVCSTMEYVATNYSMGSCERGQRGLCFTIVNMGWTVTLATKYVRSSVIQ
jgi:hypothetical protein